MATEETILARLGLDTEEYERKLARLEEEYSRQRQQLMSERESALAAAYRDFRTSGKNLADGTSAGGRQGGLEKSDRLRILTEYLEARRAAESLFGGKLRDGETDADEKREDYKAKLRRLKKEADIEIAAIKAKEAAAAAKAAAKAAKKSGSGKTGGYKIEEEEPESVYQPKMLYKPGQALNNRRY